MSTFFISINMSLSYWEIVLRELSKPKGLYYKNITDSIVS
jgi:hypothetical protein